MPEDVFATVLNAESEEHASPHYRFDNSKRSSALDIAIQRTRSGAAWIRDASGYHEVPAGHAMLFTHREPTSYGYPEDATEPYRLRYLTAKIGGLASFFARLRADFGSVVRMPDDCEATALLDEIHERFRFRTFRDRLHESELVHQLLIALYREQVKGTRTSDPIEFGHHYLRSHFRSPINLKLVSEKCGVSREHFIREFTHRYAESPGALLRRLRLEQARAMLAATHADVESIALASGYASANTFCRAYRLKFGHSPRGG